MFTFVDGIGLVRYINIPTWLRGFRDKLLYLVLFSLYPSLFWELRDKRTLKKYSFDPKVSEPCYNIEISNVAYWKSASVQWMNEQTSERINEWMKKTLFRCQKV